MGKKREKMENSEPGGQLLIVTQQGVKDLKSQRELLRKFVQSQLVEAKFSDQSKKDGTYGEGDYGIIPGTNKRCLFKPGAEKLLRLFGLGVRFRQVDKEIDKVNNIALYTYRSEVYIVKSGLVVAECDATANSQEEKYKEKTKWRTNERGQRESTKVETPIFDILNTLQKMAQKRAFVGACILATGASEYFTQDSLDEEDLAPKEPPKDVTPKPEGSAVESAPFEAPICHDQPMVISKYVDKDLGHKPFYCMVCRAKKPAVAS